jgi:hypothetical protein
MARILKYQSYKPCRDMDCPFCGKKISFYFFSGMGDMAPHFYCSHCSNVLFRDSDRDLLYKNRASKKLLQKIEATLPECRCGGRFTPGANPKCPHCKEEFDHQDGPVKRLNDPYAVVVKGAKLVSEVKENS